MESGMGKVFEIEEQHCGVGKSQPC